MKTLEPRLGVLVLTAGADNETLTQNNRILWCMVLHEWCVVSVTLFT